MDEDMSDHPKGIPLEKGNTSKTSFKNMLLGSSGSYANSPNPLGNINPLIESQLKDGDESDDDLPLEGVEEDSKCQIVLLSKEEKRRLCKPWKKSLIIKMFNKNIDVGCLFYVAHFSNMEDYNHVLLDGPWLIGDHYLTISTWVHSFVPDNEPKRFLTTWLRIPNLEVEYFDAEFLH
ncbi:Bifunctional protein GlmU [Bienertia sinuspersici]